MCSSLKIFLVIIFGFFMVSSYVMAGEEKVAKPQLKIVVGEDGSVKVYDMLGNLIADKPGAEQGEQITTSYKSHQVSPELEKENQLLNKGLHKGTTDKIGKMSQENIQLRDKNFAVHENDTQSAQNADESPNQSMDSFNELKTGGKKLLAGNADEPAMPMTPDEADLSPTPVIIDLQSDQHIILQEESTPTGDKIEDANALPNLMNYTGSGSDNNTTYNSTTHVITYNVSVANLDDANAGPFRIGFYISTNTIISTGDKLLMIANATGLESMHYLQATGSIDLDDVSGLSAGTYYPGVYIDDTFQVSESNESDNTRYWGTSPFPFTYSPTTKPNLTRYTGTGAVRSHSYNTSTHVLTLNYSVVNNGAAAAGAFRVGWYLSENTSIETSDHFLAYYYISSLAVGAYRNTTNTKDVDDLCPLAAGDYYVGVMIDYQDTVDETNESDNDWYFIDQMTWDGCGQPNLTRYTGTGAIRSCSYNTSTHVLTLNYSVVNNGTTAAGAFRVGWYLSDNTSIGSGDPFLTSYYISTLAVGAYRNTTNTKDVDDLCPLAAGVYYVMVYIDYQDTVDETSESDNIWYFIDQMTWGGCDTKPNLTDYTGTGANNSFSYNTLQHRLTLSFSVQNDGDATAGAFRTGWYLSDNTTISTSDHYVDHDAVSSLAVGSYATFTASKDLDGFCGTPDEIPSGVYYVGVIIDDHFDIDEKDENDNNFYFSSTINYVGCGTPSNYKISGTMNYYMGSATALNNVQTDLSGDATHSTTSNSSGFYEFANLSSGNYSVLASKARSGSPEASISAFDASYILRHYVGDPALTISEAQKIAADASGNGSISPFDASIVLRYYVGQDVSSYEVANWKFVVPPVTAWLSPTTTRSYAPLGSDMTNQNFHGILLGDVTGNYSGSMLAKAGDGMVVPGEMKSLTNNMLELPVRVQGASAYRAVSFELNIDKEQLQVENVILVKESENVLMAFHERNGSLRVAVASAHPIKDTDLLRITFKNKSHANLSDMKIQLMNFEIDAKRVDSPQEWMVAVEKLPQQFDLKQNYPNPFNPSTKIVYSVPQRSTVNIVIYNTIGQKLRELLNTSQDAGNYEIPWDGKDENGVEAPSGVYIVRFQADNLSKTIKVVKTK